MFHQILIEIMLYYERKCQTACEGRTESHGSIYEIDSRVT